MPTNTDTRVRLEVLIEDWETRADWAASDDCPRDFYPQDAFGECIDAILGIVETLKEKQGGERTE